MPGRQRLYSADASLGLAIRHQGKACSVRKLSILALTLAAVLLATAEVRSQAPSSATPKPEPAQLPAPSRVGPVPTSKLVPRVCDLLLEAPTLSNSPAPNGLPPAQLASIDRPLPINLATALRLSDARPLLIAAAQARVQISAAQLEKARVLWLPNAVAGANYYRHDGGIQNTDGSLGTADTNLFIAGGSLELRVSATDAIFEPLAVRQELRARQVEVQAAKNEALLQTAEAYFKVQEARGIYAGMSDATDKARDLLKRVQTLSKGLAAPDEINRAHTLLAELEQSSTSARQRWRVESANLTRVLRLNPAAVIVPQEPDHMQITLIAPNHPVDDLIPVGLTNRPELAAHQALVQATLVRLREERLRPLIPSLLVTGNGTPDFYYQGGIFGTGNNSNMNQYAGRADVNAQMVWKLENLGFGNQARIRERRGQVQLATVELFAVQDRVAAEVVQAQADVESAFIRVGQAETGLKQSLETYSGNLKGLGQTTRFGDVLNLVNRPQEAVAALQQLQQAYSNFYRTVAEYNRAQFRLFFAMGYPANLIACERTPGSPEPIDTTRPGYLPPVHAPEPCVCPH